MLPPLQLTLETNTISLFISYQHTFDLADIVWWNDTENSLNLLVTVCFECNFDDAAQRKLAKYNELWKQAKQNGYSTTLLPIQMGSRGVPHYQHFERLAQVIGMSKEQLSNLIRNSTKATLTESFSVRCSRNHLTT